MDLGQHQLATGASVGAQCLGPPALPGPPRMCACSIPLSADDPWASLTNVGRRLLNHMATLNIHVDSKRLKALLETAHGIKLEGAGAHPEIHAADLRKPQRADGHKACRVVRELGQPVGLSLGGWEEAEPLLPSQL